MTNLASLIASVETIADATEEQWDAARTRLLDFAPDLYECVTGEQP